MSKSFVTGPLLALGSAGMLCASVLGVSAAQKIRVYDIPKESSGHEHGAPAGPSSANATDPHAGVPMGMPKLKWGKLPEGWKENAEPGQMRAASFTIIQGDNEGDLGVFPIGEVPNVELEILRIWRAQLKLADASELEITGSFSPVTVGEASGKLFEFVSTEPVLGGKYKARVLVASIKRADANWFFKFAGEDAFVASQRTPFFEFLKGVTFETASAPPSQPPAAARGGGMGSGMGGVMQGGDTVKAGTGEHPAWQVPASWTAVDHSSFIVAKFRATGEGGASADINVSTAGGAGGGLLPNVNRWRGQLSLGPLDPAGLEKIATVIELPVGKATLIDMSGAETENGGKSRCVGVMVPLSNATWFYKLAGSEAVVAREKEAFLQFVRSVKY